MNPRFTSGWILKEEVLSDIDNFLRGLKTDQKKKNQEKKKFAYGQFRYIFLFTVFNLQIHFHFRTQTREKSALRKILISIISIQSHD